MTKKDYELIAAVIAKAPVDMSTRACLSLDFMEALQEKSARFDRNRFLIACRHENYPNQ